MEATKFIQLCASQNDLFALDDSGEVYRYDFNAKSWVQLVGRRKPPETRIGSKSGSTGEAVAGQDGPPPSPSRRAPEPGAPNEVP